MLINRLEVKNEFLNEKYKKIKHCSGLTIFLIEKEMSTSYAILGANFGSMDNTFLHSQQKHTLPDGVAHFLEHKLFEEPDGSDAFERFSLYGANANAYTSYDKTCYLFSCTDYLYENLEILLDFVTKPVFTKESIQKEIGIISQEIDMEKDDPNRCVYNNMISAMYHNSPIIADVAGDLDSISTITPEILFNAYNAFYSLDNMSLCLCGAFKEDKVVEICDKILRNESYNNVEIIPFKEPREIKTKEVHASMVIAQPIFSFGFKGDIYSSSSSSEDLMRKTVSLSIATKAVFGRSSDFFDRHYSSGLINKSFSFSNYFVRNHLFGIIDGTSINPKSVYEAILDEIESVKKNGLRIEDFNRAKKSIFSNVIMSFDSTEEVANNFMSFAFEKYDFFDYVKTIIDISPEEAYNDFIDLYNEEFSVISIIDPID